ncbi:3-phenylpropionate-dihydrodiol/cinnamic acid-dihydrodiol dehydrogenase [Halalkalicoccus paucihalophilus]|uniref:3-phenylpropionate-dihydrodiol/cinnamic acid-dihydrodiol dehydrogenase n=1 Tax=Halalkalicoccus paucihalophilus TaxID=1008153 RepID=A0A151A9V9_9EURY|nr:3-oxoacyl-ACP reductase family protein [Halalkalicoccus paucihalophilus]KYH24384.1 3-phenylpropionate-dihydrodiol/cinnamic acid-dihydrodiol dehydrogenase [Halalkalicoccus paucihalophilus]
MSLSTQYAEKQPDTGLKGKTIVVTGGSRGIGRSIAEKLGARGGNIAVNYRSSEGKATNVANRIEQDGGDAITVQGDVADFEAMQTMADHVHDEFGAVDVLVNNAGITMDHSFERMTPEEWDSVVDTNLTGVFNTTKAFYDDIKDADEGRIINISSLIGEQGNFGQANYAAAKAGVHGLTMTLAKELASTGATANCVSPGFTETDMFANVSEDIQENIRDDIPLSRFAQPEDIAALVRFLASEESGYITGQVLPVSGGQNL